MNVAALKEKPDRAAWLKGGQVVCSVPPRKPPGNPVRLVLLGAPGVGKGTQAELLSDRLGCCHLSTGDVFRTAKSLSESERTPALNEALEHMRRGELVPDRTVLALVTERLRCLHCRSGFSLDGFPRTLAQAEALERLLKQEGLCLSAVLNYQLPLEEIIARLAGRRTCPICKAVYHTTALPPRRDDACDHCGVKLLRREDDRPESVRVRMAAYEESTRPLIDFYRQRDLLITVAAGGTPEETFHRTMEQIGGLP
ncbi:MAG: nucleoside monophosphate kinase [Verrucomicrobiota bacterium]|nr:nucleoside monophosphate kinase [Verrucomicrobiota bacterium]